MTYYAYPPILDEIPLDNHVLIEASAGTGKTYTIEHLVVHLLLHGGCRIDEILVVTFTEKATGELRARLRAMLEKLLTQATDEAPTDRPAWQLGPDERRRIGEALSSFDAAAIFTIHGFCQRVLGEYAFHNGQLFSRELVDGRTVFNEAYRHVLRYYAGGDDKRARARRRLLRLCLAEYNPEQLEDLVWKASRLSGRFEPLWNACLLTGRCEDWHESLADCADDQEVLGLLEEKRFTPESAFVQDVLAAVTDEVNARKHSRGWLDFDDMLNRVGTNLKSELGPALAAGLRARYRYALIDEFQDTDRMQWDIFRTVFVENGRSNPLFLIGDPKQAIYGFRGADVHTYLEAARHIERIGGKRIALDRNYRSTGALIDAYNTVLTLGSDGDADLFFSGGIRYDHPVGCGNPSLRAADAEGNPAAPVVVLHYGPTDGDAIKAGHLRWAYGRRIALEIDRLLAGDAKTLQVPGDDGALRSLKASDIFVLTRSNAESLEIGRCLREARISHAFYKQEGLFQSAEASDIRDVLAAVAHPADTARRLRALITPFFAVDPEEIEGWRDLPGGHPVLLRLDHWVGLAEQGRFVALFGSLLEDTQLVERELLLNDSEREITNYLHILEILTEEASRIRCDLHELITRLDGWIAGRSSPEGESGNVQRLESEREAVQIMTIHKSKGLEAAVVFLYGGISRQNLRDRVNVYHRPSKQERERLIHVGSLSSATKNPVHREIRACVDQEQLEEAQRLYYVGLTRAKARMYLPYVGPATKAEGPYACVNDRLRRIGDRLKEKKNPEADTLRALFQWESFTDDVLRIAVGSQPRAPKIPEDFAAAQPPLAEQWYRDARSRHAAMTMQSFTRMKKADQAVRLDEAEVGGEDEEHVADLAPAEGELPARTEIGVFLHEVLEHLPFDVDGSEDEWKTRSDIARVFESAFARYNIALSTHRRHAISLAYRALTCPIPLIEGGNVPGVRAATRDIREPEFVFPIPDDVMAGESLPSPGHGNLAAAVPGLFRRRGFIKGYIDLIFEYDNRIFVLDWKSNFRPSWDPATLRTYVDETYGLQYQIYTLAVLRMFGINNESEYHRFGGSVYLFLRGLDAGQPGQGVVHHRPSWAEIERWQQALSARKYA